VPGVGVEITAILHIDRVYAVIHTSEFRQPLRRITLGSGFSTCAGFSKVPEINRRLERGDSILRDLPCCVKVPDLIR